MAIRHGRERTAYSLENDPDTEQLLDFAIQEIKTMCPTQWEMIINYIDSCATMPPKICNNMYNDNYIARVAAEKQGAAAIFSRLTHLYRKPKGEK